MQQLEKFSLCWFPSCVLRTIKRRRLRIGNAILYRLNHFGRVGADRYAHFSDTLDVAFNFVARLDRTNAFWCTRHDDISRMQPVSGGCILHKSIDIENRAIAYWTTDEARHSTVSQKSSALGSRNFVLRHKPRSKNRETIKRFSPTSIFWTANGHIESNAITGNKLPRFRS